jgi:nucleotide-binding universal stress UspA family protein
MYRSAMSGIIEEDEGSPLHDEVAVVLAAIDTSSMASKVVDTASRVARRTWPSAQLHLVHVYRVARFDRPGSAGLDAEEMMAEARAHLDYQVRMARRQSAVSVTGHFAAGDPVEEIVKVARAISADWVLVGTHDLTGLDRLLTGSVAEKVARRAPCSVLVVRSKQRPMIKVT